MQKWILGDNPIGKIYISPKATCLTFFCLNIQQPFISTPWMQALADCDEMFIDGTFRTVPSLFYQLVTIHVTAFSYVRLQFLVMYIHSNHKS